MSFFLSSAFAAILQFAAIALGVPVAVLLSEILAASHSFPAAVASRKRASVGIVIPAHDEGAGVEATIANVRSQLSEGDRLIVVADNCSDDTADIARAAGAETIERRDKTKIGKGFALDFGVRHLAADPTEIVIFIDADCLLEPNSVVRLAEQVSHTGRPAQARYLMTAPDGSPLSYQISEFAWRVKNWVRPLGLFNLSLPCQMTGAGMALPFAIVRKLDFANGELAEDLKLGIDLSRSGHPSLFCPDAVVVSRFAGTSAGRKTQQTRWEQGHLRLLLSVVREFLLPALSRRDVPTLALILDLSVPPIMLLSTLLFFVFVCSIGAALLGGSRVPLYISLASIMGLAASLALAWRGWGRDVLTPKALAALPGAIAAKLQMYLRILTGRGAKSWIRTDRDNAG
ncbi:MAG: glycosyltransferase family 2 protein [Hyphomicrobium sp.]|uniref:glycosyltransferase family 2 protein n=1 Tax=Hyphomicrobium sp. TaxID=82 RepID=UPI0039E6E609